MRCFSFQKLKWPRREVEVAPGPRCLNTNLGGLSGSHNHSARITGKIESMLFRSPTGATRMGATAGTGPQLMEADMGMLSA
jgi:hypothetical protein